MFALEVLATWYICYTLMETDGPFNVLYNLRRKYRNKLIECIFCMSFYVAFIVTLALSPSNFVVHWLALAGATSFLNEIYLRVQDGL